MGLLGDFTAYIDNLKRRGSNTLADLATNPLGLLSRNLSAFSESLPAAPDSVMPSGSGLLNRPGFQQWGMDVALNAPTIGLLGMTKPKPDYGITHRPMNVDGGAAKLHDLTPAFGEDVYGPRALQYFGSGDARESSVLRVIQKLRGNPDAEVTVYRGVPKDAEAVIRPGDWVTLSQRVAADYGPNVVKMKVKAKDITSWPDSLLEFGYFPEK